MREHLLIIFVLVFIVIFSDGVIKGEGMGLKLKSDSFEHMGEIPLKHTCKGDNISPSLSWENIPLGTKSFVLIADDPDAPNPESPQMTWVHWLAYDIPAGVNMIPERILSSEELPVGGHHGRSDFNELGYGGPCPPIGKHRYFFKLYALDTILGIGSGKSKRDLEVAMSGHVLEEAVLIGKYQK